MKVLIVEDTLGALMAAKAIFTQYGFEVRQAVDGSEAVATATQETHDLIMMDIGLPYIDGIEATRQIVAAGVTAPIVGLTANLGANPIEKLVDAGMKMAYEKPLLPLSLADIFYRFHWFVPKNGDVLIEKLPGLDSYKENKIRWGGEFDEIETRRHQHQADISSLGSSLQASFEAKDWQSLQKHAVSLHDMACETGSLRLALACFWLSETLNSNEQTDQNAFNDYYKLANDALIAYQADYDLEYSA